MYVEVDWRLAASHFTADFESVWSSRRRSRRRTTNTSTERTILFRRGYSCFSFVLLFLLASPIGAQRIDTQPQTVQARVGESVQLPCTFTELNNEDTVVMWKRGSDLLAIDEDITGDNNRVQVKKDGLSYILEISPVESYDSASYTCSVSSNPPVEITHKLQVNVPPIVKLVPSVSPLVVRVGEELIVKCAGAGNPLPTVTWTKRGGNQLQTGDARLRIASVIPSDSGLYECRASNGVGDEAKATIEIRVGNLGGTSTESSTEKSEKAQSKPWVETDRTYIPAKLGAPVNLSCRYGGEPEPNVDWLFSGFKINNFDSKFKESTKLASFVKNYTVTTFAIGEVRAEHFGDYTCKIDNSMGTETRTIHLSGRPGPPLISVLNDNYLSWTVQSAQPIYEYKIHYRLSSEDLWTHNKVISVSKGDQQGEYWSHKVSLNFLNADTDYEIQVNARNELGWGSLARDFVNYRSSSTSGKILSNALDNNVNAASSRFSGFALCLAFVLPTLLML